MAIMMIKIVVMTGNSLSKLSFVQRIRLKTMRRPMVRLAAINSAVPSTARPTDQTSSLPADASPNATAMMTQPIVSSRIADATMIWPRSRRMKFISRTTIATIFTEEIDSAVPRKIAVTSRASGLGRSAAGSISPSAKPHGERQRHSGNGNGHGGAADPLDELQVGFHAGEQQQQQDAELRNGIEHALLFGGGRKQRMLSRRPQQAEHGRPKQQATD